MKFLNSNLTFLLRVREVAWECYKTHSLIKMFNKHRKEKNGGKEMEKTDNVLSQQR